MKHDYEVRSIPELRAADDGSMKLVGYAATFNSPSKDLGGFVETVAPGAFTRAITEKQDVKCLLNHDPNFVLGRVQNSTLYLEQDARGLKFACELDPKRESHREVHAAVKRGDINECSFAFHAPENGQRWADVKDTRGRYLYQARTLTDVDLFDVSAVTHPAYSTTKVVARSVEMRALRAGALVLSTGKILNDDPKLHATMLYQRALIFQDHFAHGGQCKFVGNSETGVGDFVLITQEEWNAETDAENRAALKIQDWQMRADKAEEEEECGCPCANCREGNCKDCTAPDCEEENCDHEEEERSGIGRMRKRHGRFAD